MTLVSTLRHRGALVIVALALAAPRAQADPVTHQFTGQVAGTSNGSGGSLDLTGLFALGQAVTIDCTIERESPGVPQGAYTVAYADAITGFAFSIGSWSGSGTPSYSNTTVTDNAPSPGRKLPGSHAVTYDLYSAQVQGHGITAPPIGDIWLTSLTYTFDDVQGTVFRSTAIPGTFPDLSEFEGTTLVFLLFDFTQAKGGSVYATLSGVTSPARVTTWGGMKALYR